MSGNDLPSPTTDSVVVERTPSGLLLLPVVNDAERLYIEPTTRCNLACTTCIRHSWDEPPQDLDFAVFEQLVTQLAEFPRLRTAHLAGFGEPLLHPRLCEMLSLLRGAGLQTELTTNGLLLDEAAARSLLDCQLGTLIVSLDGVDNATFAAVRTGAELPAVLANVRRLTELRDAAGAGWPLLGVEFVAMESNYRQIPSLLRLAVELRLNRVLITNLQSYTAHMVEEALYDDGYRELDLPVSPWYCWHWGLDRLRLPYMRLRTERSCPFVQRKSLVIAADGSVSPCYPLMHGHREYVLGRQKDCRRWVAGNLNERTLAEIWTNPPYLRFRARVQRFDFPSCADCITVDACYFAQSNAEDCWANSPTCADCLWARGMVLCY